MDTTSKHMYCTAPYGIAQHKPCEGLTHCVSTERSVSKYPDPRNIRDGAEPCGLLRTAAANVG